MQFLERLEADGSGDERWLVQTDANAPHVAWFLQGEPDRLRETADKARPLRGSIHPRIGAIREVRWHGNRLVIECDDDRGPLLVDAARVIEDPVERERWVIAQFIAICDGLATMRGVDRAFVHRQLEPERMFVDISGRARLRAPIPQVMSGPRPGHMGAAVVMGTPAYMSPEQARGVPVTASTDVFALATNLYEALSGKSPFVRETFSETLMAILMEEPPPITTHAPGLSDILRRAFVKPEADRIRDPGTFAGELWQCVPDAVDYDEVVSDRIVEWRATAESAPSRGLKFSSPRCRMKWEQLEARGNNIRHCSDCRQDVVRIESLSAVLPLLGQRCVWYSGGD